MRTVACAGLAIVLMGCLSAVRVAAEERAGPPKSPDATDRFLLRYELHPVIEKLARGTGNTLGGWLEIPLNIQQRYATTDTATSILSGAALGLIKGVVRTGVGLYEVVTCWLPYPPRFAPILPTLEYFKPSKRREPLLLE